MPERLDHITKKKLFGSLNLRNLELNPDFKEDSVREEIILPILHGLGYSGQNIVRSKTLLHPFLKVGSQKRPIKLIPDYALKIADRYAWVLDAKSPNESVKAQDNIEQVYSYASHPEIRSTFFALCNGKEFILFRRDATDRPVLYFDLEEVDQNWDKLNRYLSPRSFHVGKSFTYDSATASGLPEKFDYNGCRLLEEIPVRKQQAKRHFGVHGYFTKQSWNVVAEYIKNFSAKGDLILDPFGGSGVTAIEALVNHRRAIHIDLNPMSVFIVGSLLSPVNLHELNEAFDRVRIKYLKREPTTKEEIHKALSIYSYPKDFALPKGSDVKVIEDLFTERQLVQLALLKSIIKKEKDTSIRNSLLLAFSSSVNKFNRTFHYTKSIGGGDSGPFRYYRYRIAPDPGILNLMDIFETKFKKVFAAKKEIQLSVSDESIFETKIVKGTATNLEWIKDESIDYIYTDPPYGKKIPYLDLSVMWNAWLDLKVTEKDFEMEAIEGGEHKKEKSEYNRLIAESIQKMYRVLKFDRWLSFVFAHKDPEFWHLIIESAERAGFEYVGAVPQKNGQTSFKKRQHPFTVLSGQLIINFRKVRNPRALMRANLEMDIADTVMQTIEGIIAKNDGATLEQINDELIIKGLELGFLDLLKKEYSDLTDVLTQNFDYNEETERYTLHEKNKFKTHIDVKLRIRYYLLSYLRRMERQNYNPTFDEIVLDILPLLRNGVTPEHQTILSVLKDIGEHVGDDRWRLKHSGQGSLFA